jgi:hypothetical protein
MLRIKLGGANGTRRTVIAGPSAVGFTNSTPPPMSACKYAGGGLNV